MNVDNYDFGLSPMANLTPIILAESGFFTKETAIKDDMITRLGRDTNGMAGQLETIQYIRNEFGGKKPICILARLLREIKRVIIQVFDIIGIILISIDDWLDENVPDWDEISEFVKDEIIAPIMEVLDAAWEAVEDAFKDVVDFITDIGGC